MDVEPEVGKDYWESPIFCDRFMNHLMDKSLREGVIPEEIWQETQKTLEKMEREKKW